MRARAPLALAAAAVGALAAAPRPHAPPPAGVDAAGAVVEAPGTGARLPVLVLDPRPGAEGGPSYDGRFTFLRIQFGTGGRSFRGFGGGRGGREPPWAHDSPRAERHFTRILDETTFVDPYPDGGKILTLDDPELFRYPVAYIVEVGFWQPTDEEVRGLREFLLKGGFLIVDDFRGPDVWNFEEQIQRVLPGAELLPLEPSHGIFDSFFHIADPAALVPPTYQQYVPLYLGIFEGNDPSGRLLAVVNYNNDIAEYWEFSDRGYYPIDLSNEAYKFGVNYVVYAMTH